MSRSQSPAASDADFVGPRTSIAVGTPVITLINILEVPPERLSELVEHCSLDGTRVANYAQWRSMEDFERMLANPEAQAHIREATAIAKAVPVLYRVNSVHLSDE
jgi:hypothetical protein